jgi:hypothetical protein
VSATPVQFPLPDQQQTSTDYTQVLVITPEDPGRPFSVAGDSGGLIVMRDDPPPRRAVAMVLGGTTQGEISYAVQLRLLAAKFPDALKLFFTF